MGAEKLQEISRADIESLIQALPFFSKFPKDLIQTLSDSAEVLEFPVGGAILTQGQINQDLYFLLEGKLSVLVDDGIVAELENVGELLGEMSVISKEACAATIVADSDVKVLRIGAHLIGGHESGRSDPFVAVLYQVYASILTHRLRETNDRAKHFEKLNFRLEKAGQELAAINASLEKKVEARTKDLQLKTEALQQSFQKLEQQNLELGASHRKLEEMYHAKDKTFSQLEELYNCHLLPFQEDLNRDLEGMKGNEKMLGMQTHLTEVIHRLEPMIDFYSTQKAMKSKCVLLIEGAKKQQVLAKLALGGTGVDLEICSSPEEVLAKQEPLKCDIVFTDVASFARIEELREVYPEAKFVLMTSDAGFEHLPLLRNVKKFPNIVSRAESDRTFTIKNIMTTVSKLTSSDIFGLEKYLSWGVDVKWSPVVSSDKRAEYIQAMDQYFEGLGVRRTTRERANQVCEEMLMNAIYDAPVDIQGKSLFNHLDRKEVIYLKPNQQGKIRYATDGMLLAVAVEDPFGSLSSKVIMSYLESCYSNQVAEQKEGKGGAGRGLHQIVENSDLVVFNIEPGKKTEVIALFNVDPKDAGERSSTFHLFTTTS